jgi:hypothetical protein
MGLQIDTENALTKEEVYDEMCNFLNRIVEKYSDRQKQNDDCRVYIKDMNFVPSSCSCCPFIQIGKDSYMYRCKLGCQFPYGFDYKHKRADDCRLIQKGE